MDFKSATPGGLTSLYDDLKSGVDNKPKPTLPVNPMVTRRLISLEGDKLREKCAKHILLDIYVKVLPLDDDFKCGNMGTLSNDVDCMLANKGCSAMQYLKGCSDNTKAPLVEHVVNAIDGIGNWFVEEAVAEVQANHERGIQAPPPAAPDESEPDVNDQLVDITKDMEYSSFIDKLKKKTIDKIVNDVSKIITGKKEEQSMAFDPKPIPDQVAATESTTSIAMDYMQTKLMKEGVEDISSINEDMIGIAIRESTLNEINAIFKYPGTSINEFASNIRFNHGTLITESAIQSLCEKARKTKEKKDDEEEDCEGCKL